MRVIIFVCTVILFIGCGSDSTDKNEVSKTNEESLENIDKQLNITILLDLSDRIEPTKYPSSPEHFERDIEIVNYFTEVFKKDMQARGAFKANGKLKVIFSPRPEDTEIMDIVSNLNIDLTNAKNTKEKKEIFDNVSSKFKENLAKIYSKTIETKKYIGSDTWRFFKNDVEDFCIDTDDKYRNILVVLTDGYIYHKDSRDVSKNRSAYLTPEFIANKKLRNVDWKERIEKGDYGYITFDKQLNNLDILVLEISPTPNFKNDEDIIKAYLTKWFEEMKVNKFELYNSDIPQYTKARIDKFLENN